MKLKIKNCDPAFSVQVRWVPNDIYQVPIGEIWRVSQTLTPLWLSSLTLWQIRYLHSHFVDVAAEPQKLRDLFKKPQFVVRLGVRGCRPCIFSARFCLSCSLCPDAFPLVIVV